MFRLSALGLFLIILSAQLSGQVRFDANFESGNLNTVTTTDSITYTVTTRQDIGGRWFYFKIRNVRNRFVRVKVTSTDVNRAVYSYDNINWERFTVAESPAQNQFEKTYSNDSVYVAYYIPYSLTYLRSRLQVWKNSSAVTIDTIGYTARNLPLYEVTVTDRSIPDSVKKHIWIHARTHPSETPSSWHFEGIMNTLLGSDPVVKYYLRRLVFHCIPFTNPDGVYYGKSRTNYDNVDVEADWAKADSLTCKEVLVLKQRMRSINALSPFKVFLNLHSQAAQFCTFWIHTAASTSTAFYLRENQFCNINLSDNPYFVPADYSFSALASKFPEGWLWANHRDSVMALTYETPYDYYSNNALVTNENLAYLGERTVYSIGEYLEYSHPNRMVISQPAIPSGWQRDTTGLLFFGNAFWKTTGGGGAAEAVFNAGMLQSGKYSVAVWYPSATTNALNAQVTMNGFQRSETVTLDQRSNGGKWNTIGTLQTDGSVPVSITVSSAGTGFVVANAVRLIYTGIFTETDKPYTPAAFSLSQNYPNPFNPATTIHYTLPANAKVKLVVYNMLGKEVAVLADKLQSAGDYSVSFNGSELPSGVYIARLSADGKNATIKMNLIK